MKVYSIEWSACYKQFLVILVSYSPMTMTLVSKHDTYLDAVRWTEDHKLSF